MIHVFLYNQGTFNACYILIWQLVTVSQPTLKKIYEKSIWENNGLKMRCIIPESFSGSYYEYALMMPAKGRVTGNSWLLRGILTPDLKIEKATQ